MSRSSCIGFERVSTKRFQNKLNKTLFDYLCSAIFCCLSVARVRSTWFCNNLHQYGTSHGNAQPSVHDIAQGGRYQYAQPQHTALTLPRHLSSPETSFVSTRHHILRTTLMQSQHRFLFRTTTKDGVRCAVCVLHCGVCCAVCRMLQAACRVECTACSVLHVCRAVHATCTWFKLLTAEATSSSKRLFPSRSSATCTHISHGANNGMHSGARLFRVDADTCQRKVPVDPDVRRARLSP